MLPCAIVSKLCILISPDAGRQPDSGRPQYYMCGVAGCRRSTTKSGRRTAAGFRQTQYVLHVRCRRMPAIHRPRSPDAGRQPDYGKLNITYAMSPDAGDSSTVPPVSPDDSQTAATSDGTHTTATSDGTHAYNREIMQSKRDGETRCLLGYKAFI